MSHNQAPQARLTTLARFPKKYFLKNLSVRSDNSALITAMNTKELWYVSPQTGDEEVTPLCIHNYEHPLTGIAEVEENVFLTFSGNLYTTHEAFAHRLDLRNWQPGSPVEPKLLCRFPESAHGLNGCCLLAPGVVLVADCFASLIWRMNLAADESEPEVFIWLEHESMGYFPGTMKPEQPGVNGVRLFQWSTA